MAIYVSDTFTVASDVALELHTPDIGGTWVQASGGATVESSGTVRDNSGGDWNRANMGAVGATEYEVSAEITCPGTAGQYYVPGVAARRSTTTASDGYEFVYNRDVGQYQLRENGTVVTSLTEAWAGDGALMKLAVRTGDVEAYVNGVSKLTRATSVNPSSQIVGLVLTNFVGGARCRADNFLVQDAVVPQIPRIARGVASG